MAMLVTVLLVTVAASIALSMVRAAGNEAQTSGNRIDVTAALRDAQGEIALIESQLSADPVGFLMRVLDGERARLCAYDNQAYQPGDPWPERCRTWTYVPPARAANVRFELTAPNPDDPLLYAEVLSRRGALDVGYRAGYALAGAGRWTWASIGSVDFSSTGPSDAVTLSGNLYSLGNVTPGTAVSLTDALVATDGSFVSAPTDPTVGWYGDNQEDVRSVKAAPLSAGDLTGAVEMLRQVACPGGDPVVTGGGVWSSHLCVAPGARLLDVNGTEVQVPENSESFAVIFNGADLDIYTSDMRIDTTENSDLVCDDCDLPAFVADPLAGGSHPGGMRFWESRGASFLGTFPPSATGVIWFAGDTTVGVCSDTDEYSTGAPCVARNGAGGEGTEFAASLTIVAGEPGAPRDILIGSSIRASGSHELALVAAGDIVIPHWAATIGGALRVDAHLLGAGNGQRPSVRSFPYERTDSGALDPNWAQSLTIVGSVAGTALELGHSGFRTVSYQRGSVGNGASPWFGGLDPTWVRVSMARISGFDVCASRACGELAADAPGAPTDLVGTAGDTTVGLSWLAPASDGGGAVTDYEIEYSSDGGNTWISHADGASLATSTTVSGLQNGITYFFRVGAVNAAGRGEWSVVSDPVTPAA